MIDLRSDTVTMPTEEMYDAMVKAKLGDDVFQEDPTVNELENKAAGIMGKSAGLLVPSGTMGNLVSILVHCKRGTELLLGDKSHTFYYEAGGISAFGGIHSRQLKNQKDGKIKISDIESSIRADNVHFPRTSAITLENTHNLCNGSPLEADYVNDVVKIAHACGMKVHVDGARIFNAAVSLEVDVKSLVKNVDSVTFCLSKGLSCPIGSVICGPEDFIKEANRWRKMLGGGMRQAGVFAAAGIVGLNSMIDRMDEDHENAKRLAFGLSEFSEIIIDPERIKTNIVRFDLKEMDSDYFTAKLRGNGVLVNGSVKTKNLRMVTHYGIISEDIDYTIEKVSKIVN